MQFTHGELTDLKYRGKPADFDMRLGWQRHGNVVYEWIQSLQGPDVYLDHMKVHGEGSHHLAFDVTDMDTRPGVSASASMSSTAPVLVVPAFPTMRNGTSPGPAVLKLLERPGPSPPCVGQGYCVVTAAYSSHHVLYQL